VAEALFNFYNKNKKIRVKSRGIIKDIPIAESVVRAMRKRGIILRDKTSRTLTRKDVEWADLIVIVADNFWIKFPGKKVLVWEIPDVSQKYFKGIVKIIEKIDVKVKRLVKRLD